MNLYEIVQYRLQQDIEARQLRERLGRIEERKYLAAPEPPTGFADFPQPINNKESTK